MTDILIVGAGLSGLFAAVAAAKHSLDVTLVAAGYGGLSISHGCIDVWNASAPSRALPRLGKNHPYRIAGKQALLNALETLSAISKDVNYPFMGTLSKSTIIPTAFGTIHTTTLAPSSLAGGLLQKNVSISIASIAGLRDFFPDLLAKNLIANGYSVERAVQLPLPGPALQRDLYATDIAHRFEDAAFRRSIAKAWKPLLADIDHLAIPAVLGVHRSQHVFESLRDLLELDMFEIPTLPPSLPGLRLEKLLFNTAVKLGVNIIIGSEATGRIGNSGKVRRIPGLTLDTAGGTQKYDAGNVILATGGFLHGGLVARQDGSIHEPVFDLPVVYDKSRQDWLSGSPFEKQPYEKYGLRVNSRMQPLRADDEPAYENLFAIGGIIAGADRQSEGSRQGIDLATAQRAVEAAIE